MCLTSKALPRSVLETGVSKDGWSRGSTILIDLSLDCDSLRVMGSANSVRCVLYDNPDDWADDAEPHLLKHESENSLVLGLLGRILNGGWQCESPVFAGLFYGEECLGYGLRTNPQHPLHVTRMPGAAAACLAKTLHKADIALKGVNGTQEASVQFASEWSNLTGAMVEIAMRQGIHELRVVEAPDPGEGKMGLATEVDRVEIESFIAGFLADTDPTCSDPADEARHIAERFLATTGLYLWRNGEEQAVSIAAQVRESKNGASISLVYTPPEHRGRGYATRLVAGLSQQILDGGKTMCNLYTNLANPTSNAIYHRIGYRKIAENWAHRFEPAQG
jgi:predicted GNAT family acetyltransferase